MDFISKFGGEIVRKFRNDDGCYNMRAEETRRIELQIHDIVFYIVYATNEKSDRVALAEVKRFEPKNAP